MVGSDGKGITSITKTGTSGLTDTYTITYSDNTTSTFEVKNGAKGDTGANGVGITNIAKTSTSGLVDTYTITYSNSTTSTFTVTNGSDATVDIVTAWNSTTSDSKVPSEKLVKTDLDKKIDKSNTTGLMKNDGNVMTGGTGASNWAIGNHTHSSYVDTTDSRLSDKRKPITSFVEAKSTDDPQTSLNNFTETGFYHFFNDTTIQYIDSSTLPTSYPNKSFYLMVQRRGDNAGNAKQTLTRYDTGETWVRIKNTNWGSWKKVMFDSDVNALIGSAITYIVGSGS